jgi:hypothetical protein
MSTSRVSKYNNLDDNIIISISNSSNLSTVHQTYYETTATRINIHPAGEELDQHAICLTPIGSHV